ncbi:MAG TPA: hypothetical protein VFZ59_13430 [Verrucomicrobiae bacterium]|nr:hypothetical protein [Verrucomicrobiae bacterium]
MGTVLRRFLGVSTLVFVVLSSHEGKAFTYQGRLTYGTNLASGIYDFQFSIYDSATEGNMVDETLTQLDTEVNSGRFSVVLDFDVRSFDGTARWLEIAVRTNGAQDFFTLSPRAAITPTPYALNALNVASNAITGAYSESVTFNHPDNVFVGNFTGNGSALTNVDAATLGGLSVTNFWQMSSNAAATSLIASNVFGGGVRATNIVQHVESSLTTNAHAELAYGSLNFPSANWWAGYEDGRANAYNGIQWWDTGWQGPARPPTEGDLPLAFIQTRMGWGGNQPWLPTLHIASRRSIRIEPGFSTAVTNFGYPYLSIGNEDANNLIFVNYHHPSIGIDINNPYAGYTNWVQGHGQPLVFTAQSMSNSVLRQAEPGIMSFGPLTNASPTANGRFNGELWFYWQAPLPDYFQNTYGRQGDRSPNVAGKMSTDGWEFYSTGNGTVRATNFTASSIRGTGGVVNFTSREVGDGNTDRVRVKLDLANNTNVFSGFTVASNGWGEVAATVLLTADNQVVGATTNALLVISSDNATAANRTFVLTTAIPGKKLTLVWSGANQGELIDDSANSGGGNVRLSANWPSNPASGANDVLQLVGVGNDWLETGRSAN